MTLCYYATSHGYGHAVRISQVIKEIPADIPVIIRTAAPEKLFREEIGRAFRYVPAEFDCGCLQSDSVTVLKRETLERYRDISARNRANLEAEVDFLRREGVTCVACDIPSFPLHAASKAGIPGIAISNFTWHDIYREYVETPDDQALLDEMAAEYADAAEALIVPMYVPTIESLFPRSRHIPMICRKGRNIRGRIEERLGNGPLRPQFWGNQTDIGADGRDNTQTRLALLYIGLWGLDIDWQRIEELREWTFLTYEDIPAKASNVVSLPRDAWPPADVAASVDVVVSKPGYGTISECLANNVPFVYIPREGFAEYAALHEGLNRWGGGIQISSTDFARGDWRPALDAALASRPDPTAYATDGARVAAEILMDYMR
jgi:L-arabinokinase